MPKPHIYGWFKYVLFIIFFSLVVLVWVALPNQPQANAALTDTQVLTSSYFGGAGDDKILDVSHQPDGSILIAGSSTKPNLDLPPDVPRYIYGPAASCGTGGFVAKLDSSGQNLIWYVRFNCGTAIPSQVQSYEGYVYVAGIAGVGLSSLIAGGYDTTLSGTGDPFVLILTPNGSTIIAGTLSDGDDNLASVKLAITNSGQPLISGQSGLKSYFARFESNLSNRLLYNLISDTLSPNAQGYLNDLVVKGADNSVYAIGYFERNIKVPYLIGFNANGTEIWRDYAAIPIPATQTADAQGHALTIDASGNLLAAFRTFGKQTLLLHNPHNPDSAVLPQLSDAYQVSYGLSNGTVPSSFVGRYNAANGNLIDATFFHATRDDGRTTNTEINAIATDTSNNVFLTGRTAYTLTLTANAFRTTYANSEAFLTILNSQMNGLIYSTYMGSNLTEQFDAISVGNGRIATVGQTTGIDLATKNPLQSLSGGNVEGHFAVFAAPYDLQLVLDNGEQIIGAGQLSQPVEVSLKDAFTNQLVPAPTNISLTLTSSSPTGKFKRLPQDATFRSSLVITLAINTTKVSFYYQDDTEIAPLYPIVTVASALNQLTSRFTILKLLASPTILEYKANQFGSLPISQSVNLSMPNVASDQWEVESVVYSPAYSLWVKVNPANASLPSLTRIEVNRVLPSGIYTATVTFKETALNSRASVAVRYEVKDVKLRIISDPQIISRNFESDRITVELEDIGTDLPVKVFSDTLGLNLASTAGSGIFSSALGGGSVNRITILADTSRAWFYYKDSQVGMPTLSVSANGLNTVGQPITIVDTCTAQNPNFVTNSGDNISADPCQITLRKALQTAQGNTINFADNIRTIVLNAALNPLPDLVNLNGTCVNNRPKIKLDGQSAGQNTVGLTINRRANLNGLAIYGFDGYGILINGGTANLDCVFVGTPDGLSNKGGLKVTNQGTLRGKVLVWQK